MTDPWTDYTADEIGAHARGELPTWHATLTKPHPDPERAARGEVVRSDISSPTEKGLIDSISNMRARGYSLVRALMFDPNQPTPIQENRDD